MASIRVGFFDSGTADLGHHSRCHRWSLCLGYCIEHRKRVAVATSTAVISGLTMTDTDDFVFIKTGRCVAQIVNEKTGRVLRALTTRVVADVDARAKKRLQSLKDRGTAPGTVLLVGHEALLCSSS